MGEYDDIRDAEKIQEARGAQGEWTGRDANRPAVEAWERQRDRENQRAWDEINRNNFPYGSPSPNVHPPDSGPSRPGIFGWLSKNFSASDRDRSFAAFGGVVLAGYLFWIAYTRGFGGGMFWNLLIPIASGLALAFFLRSITILVRPLRWAAVAVFWMALIWIGYTLIVAFLNA